jgi:hypothetical protein
MSAAVVSQPEAVACPISSEDGGALFLCNHPLPPSNSGCNNARRILPLLATKKVEHGGAAAAGRLWSWSDGGELAGVDGLSSLSSSPSSSPASIG